MVALVIGGASIVFGVVALVETGFDADRLYEPHTSVAGFHHTQLLAIIEIAFGVGMLIAAATPAGRVLMALLSIAALGLGLVTVAGFWEGRLHDYLGVHDRFGWLFVAVGAAGLLSAVFLPTVHRRDVEHTERLVPSRASPRD